MKTVRILLIVLMSAIGAGLSAQTIDELNTQIRRDKEQLETTNKLIDKKDSEIRASERNRKLLDNNITTRKKIVSNLEKQTSLISDEIKLTTRQVRDLDIQLENLRKDYGNFVYASWKNHKMNNAVAFLFASRDFNDAQRRVSHMKRYNHMREVKAAEIDSISFVLNYEIEKMNLRKQELDESRAEEGKAMAELDKEKKQLATIESKLTSDRKKLDKAAKDLKSKINKAQTQVDKIIAEQSKSSGRTQAQKEQDIVLSGKFEDNKGKLPWPVSGGSVLHRFGPQKVSAEITTNFKGIDIAAPRGAAVKAVFEGEVTGVYNMEHFNACVMVRSGNYIILYANLAKTNVKTGDKVAINQQLGSLFDTADTDQHMLVFQIWRETTPVDPQLWLRK